MVEGSSAFKVVIPARYNSQRLPGKPLRNIAGKAMILHVCERATLSRAEDVWVATDDERIHHQVIEAGYRSVITASDHQSGTERIVEVGEKLTWDDQAIVVNVQGDEPLIDPQNINQVASALEASDASVATLAAPIENTEVLFNPNSVKVVTDRTGRALYFSRAPIPWDREVFSDSSRLPADVDGCLRHIGIYAYRMGFLRRYAEMPISPLENIEALEQLRVLWNGSSIQVSTVAAVPEAGVDTEDDIQRVELILSKLS